MVTPLVSTCAQAEPPKGDSACWITHLEQQLQAVPGIDVVLAALVQHCQQNMAAGGKLTADLSSMAVDGKVKAEIIDVTCLSSPQEQHSSARALPLLLRLYFTNCSRLGVSLATASCTLLTESTLLLTQSQASHSAWIGKLLAACSEADDNQATAG